MYSKKAISIITEAAANIECEGNRFITFDADEIHELTPIEKIVRCRKAIARYKLADKMTNEIND